MPLITETIVTTQNAAGVTHIAPLGLIQADDTRWIIAPFAPSTTLDNLRAVPFAVASHVDDARIYAGCLTGRKDWPLASVEHVRGMRLAAAVSHWELAVAHVEEDAQRPRFICDRVAAITHTPWAGYNRAQAAVLECAVLVSRLHMLEAEKIESELAYLEIAIAKTAGPRELEAWGWLMERIDHWRLHQEEE